MKKIQTLFERVYEHHKVVGITDKATPGMEWVLAGEGEATVKIDGSCCAIINGELYKRYDAKKGREPLICKGKDTTQNQRMYSLMLEQCLKDTGWQSMK